jgi:aspartyl-tRNA(Asn)/glutamyl-tRNA(Gln) amidotransferase subunit A
MSDDLCMMSAVDLVAHYRARKISPAEVTRAVFERINKVNGPVNAFVYTLEASATAEAKASEARWKKGAPLGLIDGVPVTIKDLADIKGHPTYKGSRTAPETPVAADSPAVALLRASGAVFVGKTTTPEFGWAGVTHSPRTGITRNPWNPAKTSGGSSGGAGVAAALGMGALHLGTDGGGSIRMPSSMCGIFGLKPTTGRIPYHPGSAMLSCSALGPMTRTVSDAALMMDVAAKTDARDWFGIPAPAPRHRDSLDVGARGLRIAYSPSLFGARPNAEIASAVADVAKLYDKLGAHVTDVGDFLKSPRKPYETFYVANLARLFRLMTDEQKAVVDPGFRAFAEDGLRVSIADYQDAIMAQIAFGAEVQQALVDYDLILSPQLILTAFEAGVEVPAGRGMTRWFDWAPYTYPFNFSNHPAASVPCGFDSSGMPMSFQLVGRKAEEALILRAAHAFERERPFTMPKAR